ncbi:MAG TPA: shikimate dehydrogenase [Alphaproteobacteria bacterium]|nr:shikimate dehydrogenase [Alphaproteobacteria bacterium]
MTLRAGVIGWPIAHSLSPRIHGHWLRRYGIDGAYEAVAVQPEELEAAITRFRAEGWRGFNVTVPHKETIIPLLDRLDPVAARIGAVNTVVRLEDGRFEGRNSDAPGFIASLYAEQVIESGKPAVLLGAGGAARAILAALSDFGFSPIRIANRNRQRAETLAAQFPAIVHDWQDRAAMLDGAALLVNATSLGMQGQPPLDIALDHLPGDAIVTDIVYRPLETSLLAAARARGNPVVDGLGMLLHQAVEGFRAWFGVESKVDQAVRDDVLTAIGGGN